MADKKKSDKAASSPVPSATSAKSDSAAPTAAATTASSPAAAATGASTATIAKGSTSTTTTTTAATTKRDAPVPAYEAITNDPLKLEDYDLMAIFPGLFWDIVTLGIMCYFVVTAPFTKVEESFNVHALHDLLYLKGDIAAFDHNEFPGVVPRTFHGAVGIWFLAQNIIQAFTAGKPEILELNVALYIIRFCVAFCFVHSTRSLRQSVGRIYGASVGSWMSLLTLSEFHLMFWGSRTLPNTFALIICNYALSAWIDAFKPITMKEVREQNIERRTFGGPPLSFERDTDRKLKRVTTVKLPDPDAPKTGYEWSSFILISFGVYVSLVHRLELLAFFAPIFIGELIAGRFKPVPFIIVGTVSAVVSIASSVLVDSYLWQRQDSPFWPEFESFKFNIVEGRASEYGVSPIHEYFTALLPRIAPIALPLSLYAAVVDPRARRLVLPAAAFVSVMSLIGHKEWRFVVYAVPLFNSAAAIAATRIYRLARGVVSYTKTTVTTTEGTKTTTTTTVKRQRGRASLVHRALFSPLLLTATAAALVATHVFVQISSTNYPGGVALEQAHRFIKVEYYDDDEDKVLPYIHWDSYAAQTGATRFGEANRGEGWRYSKSEKHKSAWEYAASSPENADENESKAWKVLGHIRGLDGVELLKGAEFDKWLDTVKADILAGRVSWRPRFFMFGIRLPIKVVMKPKVFVLQRTNWKTE
ncbi:Alg9-like mannosyltransferase family-domain-containing protein [Zopfochytrium polystomum]|nr:Alg9-like mannosyltransferase family-domain-containing protein [Zopfochytrium polystomum]